MWWRFYTEALDDPKVQRLSGDDFKAWVNLLCIAKKHDGILPSIDDVSFALRMQKECVSSLLNRLVDVGLFDETKKGMEPHNWKKRQYKSDTSTDRVKRFRKRYSNVSETPPETEQKQSTEQRQNRAEKKDIYSSNFLRWYEHYPHKVGKADAAKAFSRAEKKVDIETLIAGVLRYVEMKPPDRSWCNPSTWLNQERWDDEYAAVASGEQSPHEALYAGFSSAAARLGEGAGNVEGAGDRPCNSGGNSRLPTGDGPGHEASGAEEDNGPDGGFDGPLLDAKDA